MLINPDKFVKHHNPGGNLVRFLGRENIVFSEGNEWKINRKLVSNSFNFLFLKESIPIITSCSEEKYESLTNMKDVDLKKELEIFMEIFFHKDSAKISYAGKPLANTIIDIGHRLMNQTMEFPYLIFGPKFNQLGLRKKDRQLNEDMEKIKLIIVDLVQKQRENEVYLNNNSLLSNLLKNEDILVSENLDVPSRIRNEILTIFFVGTDTASSLLLNSFHLILKHESCLQKILKEIEEKIDGEENLTFESINKLDYLAGTLNEVLRFHGPGLIFLREN